MSDQIQANPEDRQEQPLHSKLGASSAERWMNCPGSVALLETLALPESDEEDWRRDGIAAHELGAHCLANGQDAWELIGEKFHDTEVDAEMSEAVQVYLDVIHGSNPVTPSIEERVSHPAHKNFYGTLDHSDYRPFEKLLAITDYKHGVGIAVDVENNPQLMYYAYAKLRDYLEAEKVLLRIVQPRGFHPDGQIREWTISAADLRAWAETELIPAMERTAVDNTLDPGPWCRFCPAKLVCPMLTSLFGAASTANPKVIVNLSDDSLGRSYQYVQAVKFYLTAMETETLRRLNKGSDVSGVKLVHKKANRVYKAGAEEIMRQHFGDDIMTKPEIKSPAEMEKISAAAKTLVHEWAYTPQTGLTVAFLADKRPGVKVQSTTETFAAAVEALDVQA